MTSHRNDATSRPVWAQLLGTPWIGRINWNSDAENALNFTALDAADDIILNECNTGNLLDIRSHVRNFYMLLLEFNDCWELDENQFDAISGVQYALLMASSLEDVVANTDVDDTSQWCRPAYEFGYAHSEAASKYMAALVFFNFLWTAYENSKIIGNFWQILSSKDFEKSKTLKRSTFGFADHLPQIKCMVLQAYSLCLVGGGMSNELRKINISNVTYAEIAADLVRRFRHYVFHGKDAAMLSTEWARIQHNDKGNSRWTRHPPEILRLYSISRLILLLIQLSFIVALKNFDNSVVHVVRDEWDEEKFGHPIHRVAHIHLSGGSIADQMDLFGNNDTATTR